MESSLNSSQSEPRLSKMLFKKPLPRGNALFDVSLNESVEPQTDKTDVDSDLTSTAKKTGPFKKDKKPLQQFNVTIEESLTEIDHEKTVANQKFMFKRKNQPEVDFFNVTECESKLTETQLDSLMESNISTEKESEILHNKSNPFRRSKRTQKEKLTPENDQIEGTLIQDENMSDTINKSNNQTNMTIDNSDTNISIFTSKKSLFKARKESRVNNIEMEVTSTEDDGDKSLVTKTNIFKSNLFKKQSTCDQMMEISSSDEPTLGIQPPNESFTPQETQSSSFRRSSSRLSAKESTLPTTSSSEHQELENSDKSFSSSTKNSLTNSRFSENDQTSPSLSKTKDSNSRNNTDANNLSSAEEIDANISTSSRGSKKKKSSVNTSKAELEASNASNSDSTISTKNKSGSLRKSTKRSRTEKSLNMSIADNDGRISKTSANSFTDIEKNRNLSTTETTKRNLSVDKNVSKTTNKSLASEITFNQSSFNDDNLNEWMSDHSDHSNHLNVEDPQIDVPPVPTEKDTSKSQKDTSNEKCQEASLLVSWEQKLNEIVLNAKKSYTFQPNNKINEESQKGTTKPKPKPKLSPSSKESKYRPPKLRKPAPFATKSLYQFLIKKLKPKYGIDSNIEAEQLVLTICDTVKKVLRKKDVQRDLVQDLKRKMAKAGIVETTLDFYEFVIRFLPYDFRVRVVPCYQPVTNTVYPPKDTISPFDKIL